MPPVNPFNPTADRAGIMQRILDRIKAFFRKFYTIADGEFKG